MFCNFLTLTCREKAVIGTAPAYYCTVGAIYIALAISIAYLRFFANFLHKKIEFYLLLLTRVGNSYT